MGLLVLGRQLGLAVKSDFGENDGDVDGMCVDGVCVDGAVVGGNREGLYVGRW